MSQTETETGSPGASQSETIKEFDQKLDQSMARRRKLGASCGPMYAEPEANPVKWYGQAFEKEITPSGSLTCERALLVGSTQNGLDIIITASHANTTQVTAASGATITITTLQADSEEGEFEAVGPSVCYKAPAEGIVAEPCMLFIRSPLGNFRKPWLKVKLEFAGGISGGLVDCGLGYVPR